MPAAEASLSSTPAPDPQNVSKKRKRAVPAAKSADSGSPAPDGSAPGTPSGPSVEQLSGSKFDPSKPIPTHSAPPIWLPVQGLPDFYLTDGICFNRNKYRYTDAVEVATYVFHSQQSPPTDSVRVCWEDRSPNIRVSQDGLGLAGDRGYRSARLNVPVREGKWYIEFNIERGGGTDKSELGRADGSHVRLGWARREAPLNGPVGLDGYSYGLCDKTGNKVTLSRPKSYGRAFGTGDVVGMYISLPPLRKADPNDPNDPAHIRRKRQPVGLKGRTYFEQVEYAPSKEMIALMERGADATVAKRGPQARPHGAGEEAEGEDATPGPPSVRPRSSPTKPKSGPGSSPRKKAAPPEPSGRALPTLGHGARIAFFVNGECQGTAFEDLFDFRQLRLTAAQRKAKDKERKGTLRERENQFDDGTLGYYPVVSLFNAGRVRVNPGPDFAFPPPPDVDALLDGVDGMEEDVKRTWRPMCERYAEHWAEMKAIDALEDAHQRETARQLIDSEDKRRIDEEKRTAQKESRRLKDAARRLQAKTGGMVHGGSKLAGSVPPDEAPDSEETGSKMDTEPVPTPVPTHPKLASASETPHPHEPVPLPSIPPPEPVTILQEMHKRKSPKIVKREHPNPNPHPHPQPPLQTIQFAPPYVYPGSQPQQQPQQRSSSGPRGVGSLLNAFDSPPRRQPPPLPSTSTSTSGSPQRLGYSAVTFDRDQQYAQAPAQHPHPHAYVSGGGGGGGGLGYGQQHYRDDAHAQARLIVDTGPAGFHPQWTDTSRPLSSGSRPVSGGSHSHSRPMSGGERPLSSGSGTGTGTGSFRYTTGPGMAGGYGPPPLSAQQQQSYSNMGQNYAPHRSPVHTQQLPALSPTQQQRPAYRPLSPADLHVGPRPLSPTTSTTSRGGLFTSPFGVGGGGPASPVAYTLQQESSLRSGAAQADDDDEADEEEMRAQTTTSARPGFGLWDPFRDRYRDDDVDMRDEQR